MKFSPELQLGTFLRRYKRFLADVLVGGDVITMHCANTGAMTNCLVEHSPCWFFDSKNNQRKYPHSLELVTTVTGHLAGINTHRANQLVREALAQSVIKELSCYSTVRSEVNYGNSRVDFVLGTQKDGHACYVEVKSVTYGLDGGLGIFPDAKSERARKHLCELMQIKKSGARAVLLFCVQHNGIEMVSPADNVDPEYGRLLRLAEAEGVELLAYKTVITRDHMVLKAPVAIKL